jgi:hypothetical protein
MKKITIVNLIMEFTTKQLKMKPKNRQRRTKKRKKEVGLEVQDLKAMMTLKK